MIRNAIPVFCYHNVSEVDSHSPDLFREHLDAIQDAGYRTISSRELLSVVRGEMKAPRKAVVLTFDDCHISNWLTVVPELEKRDMTGTFFALTDFTVPGAIRTWDDAPEMRIMPDAFRAAHDGDFGQFLNESELKAMLDKGMEIFSHGGHHQGTFVNLSPRSPLGTYRAHWVAHTVYSDHSKPWPTFKAGSAYVHDGFWPRISEDGALDFVTRSPEERLRFCREDFRKSFEWIRDLNGYDEQLFCWPWGQFDNDAEGELKKAGFAGAFTLERWANAKGTNPFRLNRIGVAKSKSGKWVQSRLRMYSSDPTARVFFKFYRKKPAVKHVLLATDSKKGSGGSRQLINNAHALTDMGIRCSAILHPESPLVAELENLGVTVHTFDRFKSYMAAGRFLKKIARESQVDVVHTFHNRAYKMGVIARLMGGGFKLFINRGVISRPNDIFFLWTALSNGAICNSMQCADVLRKHRVSKKRLNVVYNAYNGPDFGDPKPRKKRGVRFIYVGNAAQIKGFDVFLKAAARFCESGSAQDVEFVGVGVEKRYMNRFKDVLTPEVEQRLRLTDVIPHADVLEEMRFSDVICVTSRLESFPNTLTEGFNLGLPGLCTEVGGIPEVLHDGLNGYLCASEDADCLAEKMRVLADDPEKRYTMGLVGRAVVRNLLTPSLKGRNLMRVYMGEQLNEPLPVAQLADTLDLPENPYEGSPD